MTGGNTDYAIQNKKVGHFYANVMNESKFLPMLHCSMTFYDVTFGTRSNFMTLLFLSFKNAPIPSLRNNQHTVYFRLQGGSSVNEGRVEVLVDGRFGLICDDHWELEDAHVVCKQLGFKK